MSALSLWALDAWSCLKLPTCLPVELNNLGRYTFAQHRFRLLIVAHSPLSEFLFLTAVFFLSHFNSSHLPAIFKIALDLPSVKFQQNNISFKVSSQLKPASSWNGVISSRVFGFYLFYLLKQVSCFSCLGECCSVVLLWSPRKVLWNVKLFPSFLLGWGW